MGLLFVLTTACSVSGSGTLFDGKDSNKWKMTGDVSVQDDIMTLKGTDALAVLKNGKYKNFDLTLDLRTTPGGKGAVWFHTDPTLKKGYRIAINNDRADKVWWKMTGSLVSVRNLTKSFVKEDQWFKMDIRVAGQEIDVNINGEPVVEYIQPTAPYRTDANAYALLSEGTFAIESDGSGEIQIKNEDGKLIWKCPQCGNTDQDKMNVARRTCGYIGTQFWNQGRTQEIKDRVLHL